MAETLSKKKSSKKAEADHGQMVTDKLSGKNPSQGADFDRGLSLGDLGKCRKGNYTEDEESWKSRGDKTNEEAKSNAGQRLNDAEVAALLQEEEEKNKEIVSDSLQDPSGVKEAKLCSKRKKQRKELESHHGRNTAGEEDGPNQHADKAAEEKEIVREKHKKKRKREHMERARKEWAEQPKRWRKEEIFQALTANYTSGVAGKDGIEHTHSSKEMRSTVKEARSLKRQENSKAHIVKCSQEMNGEEEKDASDFSKRIKEGVIFQANHTQDREIDAQVSDRQCDMLKEKKKSEEAISIEASILGDLAGSSLKNNENSSIIAGAESRPVSVFVGSSLNRKKEGITKPSKKEKKVTFSDQQGAWADVGQCRKLDSRVPKAGEAGTEPDRLEEDEENAAPGKGEDGQYVWNARFSPEEDEAVKKAVFDYIKRHGWNEQEGLEKVLNCSRHKEAWHCWVDIQKSIPHRPRKSVRHRAHVLLEKGSHLGRWSRDEREKLLKLHEEYGHKWRTISNFLGRGRINVREKWRTFKLPESKGGWTQAELQKLSELVHKCLWIKAKLGSTKKQDDHRMIRDDINWEQIADEIRTHGHGSCCGQWYYTLASSMVASGEWAVGDDRLLLQGLLESGACTVEEVDWDRLLDHRSGQTSMRRWQQMVKHLGEYHSRQFLEKLELLTKRYAPDLLGVTEYDNDETEQQASLPKERQ